MTDYADLIARLRESVTDPVTGEPLFDDARPDLYAIDVGAIIHCFEKMQAEVERLRAQVEVAEAGYINAVRKAEWQSSTNAELNRLIRQRNDISMECERLRVELAEPVKRAPLTDEAILTTIHRASITVYNSTGDEQLLRVGRQIERAHGIGDSDDQA